jgi:hypothetical protein
MFIILALVITKIIRRTATLALGDLKKTLLPFCRPSKI